ncbi:ComEC/Rec2 family competence protein [Aureisphaera galaxeae]|uniref:ComEC/Rec2 family competence protein n=1 Tax=Aureisphaera galaxeae TaxID=1538023 RepID=UPI00235034FC|nr:ComEC/Rec2 family competence protein [Aureisphaera galaxeae]MDC8003028.1 ComEC/Rec2 family competence protein [Aureisphaera galaxeae]
MRFINFLILKLAACLTLGIILAHYFHISPSFGTAIFSGLLLLLVLSWFFERKQLRQGPFFGILTFLFFTALGYLNLQISQPHFQPNHYVHLSPTEVPEKLSLQIVEVLTPDRYHHRYFGRLLPSGYETSQGKLLISIRNDAHYFPLHVDDHLVVSTSLQPIPPSLNPHQFNYKEYLEKQGVYNKIIISRGEILERKEGDITLKGFAEGIRSYVSESIQCLKLSEDATAITQALVLGERRAINKELYHNYAAAGAIHILAVSGLHVGMLFLFFSWLFKPLEYLPFGKWIKAAIIVLLLWAFALLAGLSPSVVRAVTMFSCFALAGMLNRPTNGFNTLFLSYFILLLLKPYWLFHVGFQLSYLAVLFILWLQPKLYGLYRPRYLVDKYLWGLVTVSLAAQIGVAPLSLYYFHQFPGLFLLTNMVILPFLGILLGFGLLISLGSLLVKIPNFLVHLYDSAIGLLNDFIAWIASNDSFLFQNISFSLPKMIAVYILILSLGVLWKSRKKISLTATLASIVLLLGVIVWERTAYSEEEFVIFHRSKVSLMAHKQGSQLKVFNHTHPLDGYPIKSYAVEKHIAEFLPQEIPNVFRIKGKTVIRLDSMGVYPRQRFDIVLLSESPKIHLDRLIESINPKLIIADGSNYKSYVARWKETCTKRKLPFHYTGEMGAYIFE